MNVTLRRLGVLSVAKIQAILMFVMSLIIAIPYGLIVILFGAALTGASGSGEAGAAGVIGGIMIMILIPVLYAIIGFVGGAIAAALYNLLAGVVGGIEMEFETVGGPGLGLTGGSAGYYQPQQGQPYQQGSYPPGPRSY